jgi:hypothetical protein
MLPGEKAKSFEKEGNPLVLNESPKKANSNWSGGKWLCGPRLFWHIR